MILTGARVVTGAGVHDRGWVQISGERIVAVGDADDRLPRDELVDLGGGWLLPGFIDIHMHGGGGHDASASPQDMAAAVAFHHRHGTTATLISLVTAPVDRLRAQLGQVAALTRRSEPGAPRVIGSHLEGPFLSHRRCGAQNPAHLIDPDRAAYRSMLDAAGGTLRQITVAPELPGAAALVREVVGSGVVAAIGHSDATYDQAHAAIEAGATIATHLFNGMRPLHHREPGIIGAATHFRLFTELINDGVHVHPVIASLLARDPERLILVTDAIDATGAGDGTYRLGGQDVRVTDGQARLVRTGSLAGSTLTMDRAVRRAVQVSGIPIEVASRAASGNPARALGIHRDVGAVAPGLRADLVLLDDDLALRSVISGGRRAGGGTVVDDDFDKSGRIP